MMELLRGADRRPPVRLMVAFFAFALIVRLFSAWPLEIPGYFDAFYYYNVAESMVAGDGMTDYVIWHYLDDPAGLPRPSHLYWMPMTTWLAWIGMELFGTWLGPWRSTQLIFAGLSALLAPLSAWLVWSLHCEGMDSAQTESDTSHCPTKWRCWLYPVAAGSLTIFSGFYFIYWTVPDTFTPFAVAVALAFLSAWRGLERQEGRWWVLAGAFVAVSHLTRADGLLVGVAITLLLLPRVRTRVAGKHLLYFGAGYGLFMAPWLWRNVSVVGAALPGGGTSTIWLQSYDEIFSYGLKIGPSRYFAWGIWPIALSKVKGVVWNSVVILGGLQFFLAPFALVGVGTLSIRSSDTRVRLVLTYGAVLFAVMALIFTFPSRRGSTLHSAAALIPWLSALVPAGVERSVRWIARWRPAWDVEQATRFFVGGFVGLAILVSLWLYGQAVWWSSGPTATRPPWNERFTQYEAVDRWLSTHNVSPTELVFVNDPPSFYGMTERRALMIPSNGPAALESAADRYAVRFLVLAPKGAGPYREAYQTERLAGWEVVARVEGNDNQKTLLFRRK